MNPCPLQLEISGPTARWTRPDTGSSPVSCVVPTFATSGGSGSAGGPPEGNAAPPDDGSLNRE